MEKNNVVFSGDSNPMSLTFETRTPRVPLGTHYGSIISIAINKNARTKNGLTNRIDFEVQIEDPENGENIDLVILKHSIFADHSSSNALKTWYEGMTGEKTVPRTIDFSKFMGEKVKLYIDHEVTEEGDVYERIKGMYRVSGSEEIE
jgi:hypothetical protein